jgi:diadenylate cyclase
LNIFTIDFLKLTAEVLFLAWAFYQFYLALDKTRMQRMIRMIFFVFVIYIIFYILDFPEIISLMDFLKVPFVVFLCVVFQPELRRSFSTEWFGKSRLRIATLASTTEQIESVVNACTVLSSKRRGALIVFPRKDAIAQVINSGTMLNADLSTSLILTVFDHDTPLHDGAMIIQNDKIIAAGCYLPLSGQADIRKNFGTRHRAALGQTEESDAIVLVVSEETGALSLAYDANLYYDLSATEIEELIPQLFSNDLSSLNELEDEENVTK